MSKKEKDKGYREEAKVVNMLKQIDGLTVQRVPLSGGAGGEFSGDILIRFSDNDADSLIAEVKARGKGQGFKTIENWLGDNDLLFLNRTRKKPLVVMPFDVFANLADHLADGTWNSIIEDNKKTKPVETPAAVTNQPELETLVASTDGVLVGVTDDEETI